MKENKCDDPKFFVVLSQFARSVYGLSRRGTTCGPFFFTLLSLKKRLRSALSHLLLEIVEQLRIEEFTHDNIQTVAQLLESYNLCITSRSFDDVTAGDCVIPAIFDRALLEMPRALHSSTIRRTTASEMFIANSQRYPID